MYNELTSHILTCSMITQKAKRVMIGTVLKSTLLLGLALRLASVSQGRSKLTAGTRQKAKREADEKAKREAEEKAKREAEEKAKRAAEEKLKRETEEKAKRAAYEKAKRAAYEKAERAAYDEAKREAEETPLSRFSLENKISDGSAAPRLDSPSPPPERSNPPYDELSTCASLIRKTV